MSDMIKKIFTHDSDPIIKEGGSVGCGSVTAVICTKAVDRDNEVVLPSGMDLSEFQKNPMVFWLHKKQDLPIGKGEWIKYDNATDTVQAKTVFNKTEKGKEIFGLFRDGFLKGFSVGARSTDFGKPTNEEVEQNPIWKSVSTVFRKSLLIEFSAVGVPCNPEALAVEIGKGVYSEDLIEDLGLTIVTKPNVVGSVGPSIVGPLSKSYRAVAGDVNPNRIFEEFDVAMARRLGRVVVECD